MKRWLLAGAVLSLTGCGGGSDGASIPGIGPDASQSSVVDAEYRLQELGPNCQPELFSATVLVSQEGSALTTKVDGETVATATIDIAGNLAVTLLSPTPSLPDLSCTGVYNAGSFDLSCPLGGGVSCDFVYTRADLVD